MNKYILSLMCAAICAGSATAESTFDAAGRMAVSQYELIVNNPGDRHLPIRSKLPFDAAAVSRGEAQASVIARLSDGTTAADLEARGIKVLSMREDMAILAGSMPDLITLSETDLTTLMSFGEEMTLYMDKARPALNADAAHNGADNVLGKAYTGKGVLAALYDRGLDPNHINFISDNGKGTTRVKSLWRATSTDGTSFTLYDTPEKIAGFTSETTTSTHGTHVLGMIAGSFNGKGNGRLPSSTAASGAGVVYVSNAEETMSNLEKKTANPYYGVAPGADILIGCGPLINVNYNYVTEQMIDYAKSHNQPLTVNMSFGSIIGPRDGTDASSLYLDKLGKEAILCVASGNDGASNQSISQTFTQSQKRVQSFIVNGGSGQIVDIWSNSSTFPTVTFVLYNTNTKQETVAFSVNTGTNSTQYFTTSNYSQGSHNSTFDEAFSDGVIQAQCLVSSSNNRAEVIMAFDLTQKLPQYALGLRVEGGAGQRVDIATNAGGFTSKDVSGWVDGSGIMSVSSLACARNIISVGAWASRQYWPQSGDMYAFNGSPKAGEILGFTSYGRLVDGRSEPLVCAPGVAVSSVSNYSIKDEYGNNISYQKYQDCPAFFVLNGRNNAWAAMQGTSMATPATTGTIALWLEADPSLKIDDVKKIIAETSVTGSFMQTSGDPLQWGAGKLNAFNGLCKILGKDAGGVGSVSIDGLDNLLIQSLGGNIFDVFAPSATGIDVKVYSMSGTLMTAQRSTDQRLTLDASSLPHGIYIVNVNGNLSSRIVVK